MNVICLIGTSRCGSTVLQAALGQFENVASLGEVKRLSALAARNSFCNCGLAISECDIWRSEASGFITSKHSRLRMLRNAVAVATGRKLLRAEAGAAQSLGRTLQAIHKKIRASVFVDSSKDPDQLLLYAALPSINVVPVHVVRDPRGVVQSAQRRTGIDPLKMTLHWRRLNYATLALRKLTPSMRWQTVRYEDFCANPTAICRDLLLAAGHEAQLHTNPIVHHTIGGSPGFTFSGMNAIHAEDNWRATMPADMQATILRHGGWAARYFGYF